MPTFSGVNPKHLKSAHLHLRLLPMQRGEITLGWVGLQQCQPQLASSWSSWWTWSPRSYYALPSGPLLSGDLASLKNKKPKPAVILKKQEDRQHKS